MEKIDEISRDLSDQSDSASESFATSERSIWKFISYNLVSTSIHLFEERKILGKRCLRSRPKSEGLKHPSLKIYLIFRTDTRKKSIDQIKALIIHTLLWSEERWRCSQAKWAVTRLSELQSFGDRPETTPRSYITAKNWGEPVYSR